MISGGTLTSSGGDISLGAGFEGANGNIASGDVTLDNAMITSDGGNVSINANRVDNLDDNGRFAVSFIGDTNRSEGGAISIANGSSVSTSGGTLVVGSLTAQNISIDGTLDTTGGAASGDAASEDGLLVVFAGDSAGLDVADSRFGRSRISLGENGTTMLTSAGIYIDARDVTTSAASPNTVTITAQGETTATLDPALFGREDSASSAIATGTGAAVVSLVNANEASINGGRSIEFNANTQITADRLQINAALLPSQLNPAETNALDEIFPAENTTTTNTRLTFAGTGGTTASNGVRLNADNIAIEIGDGVTASDDLLFEALDDGGVTDFAFQRGSRGDYDGLQLRDTAGAIRPEVVSIRQDGDLTIGDGSSTPGTELFFGGRSGTGATTGAFANAPIGAEGMRLTLESSDGVLEIQNAAGLSSDTTVVAGSDAGRSRVTLNGGLLLPDDAMSTEPSGESIVFSGTFLGDAAFNVEGLTVSTPRNLTLTTQIADAIASAAELEIRAGRVTTSDEPAKTSAHG